MEAMTTLATGALELLPFAHWDNDDGPGWIFGLVFWVALIAVVLLLIRGRGWFGPGPGPRGGWDGDPGSRDRESGSQILDRRFAEGELSVEEYRERRTVLDEGKGK